MDQLFCMHIVISHTKLYEYGVPYCMQSYIISLFMRLLASIYKITNILYIIKGSTNYLQTITPHPNKNSIGCFQKIINKILAILAF